MIRRLPKRRSPIVHFQFEPIFSIIAGILILIMPKLLNFIVAIYLILMGISGLVR